MKEPKEIFAENLKYYMDMHDVTQKELSEIVGVSPPTVHDWVKGKKYPRMDKVERIANYFGIQKSDLIEDANPIDETIVRFVYDVADQLENTLEDLADSQTALMFSGEIIDDETRELLRISLENSIKIAKVAAKNKYTPKKYRKKQGGNNGNSNKTE